MNKKLILVGGLPRTGGSLIPFFMDGHDKICNIPFELHISNIAGYIPDEELFKHNSLNQKKKIILRKKFYNKHGLTSLDKSGTEYDFNFSLFIKKIDLFLKSSIYSDNYLYDISKIWLELRGAFKENNYILNHSGRAFTYFTEDLYSRLDLGFYIYTKRNFLDWYASIIRSTNRFSLYNDESFIMYSYDLWSISNSLAKFYVDKYKKNFYILDYDFLLESPDICYNQLCDFLNINIPDNKNTNPTYLGFPTRANSSFKKKRKIKGELVKPVQNKKVFDDSIVELINKQDDKLYKIDNTNKNLLFYHKMILSYYQYWNFLRSNNLKTFKTRDLAIELKDRIVKKFFQ